MTEPEQPTSGYGTFGPDGAFQPPADATPGQIPPGAPYGAPNGPGQPPYGGGEQWQYGAGAPGGAQGPYYYGYGYPQQQGGGTSGMAIAAMVCGICGFLCLIPGVVGVILGLVSLPQIKRSGQSGRGMAITGIVAGALWILCFILLMVFANNHSTDPGTSTF